MIEPITFSGGVNYKSESHALKEGELQVCEGFTYDHHGVMETRLVMASVNSVAVGHINLIHRYINWILLADGGNLRYKWDLDGYCDLYTPPNGNFTALGTMISSNRPRVADYGEFSFIVTGSDKKVFTDGNLYEWDIVPPLNNVKLAAGAAGNPNGTYYCYCTFVIKFPNGTEYETAPSPVNSQSVTNQKLMWSGIPLCTYSGTGLLIYRRLYRYSTGLGAIFLVTEIQDNTTTTYTDDLADGTVNQNDILSTADYDTPPEGVYDVCEYLQRVFVLKDAWLYPSEPYEPFAFVASEAIPVLKEGDSLVTALPWGDQLYLASASSWYRLQGSSSDTWAIRNTFAEKGVINRHTVKKTRYGVIGLWHDGLYIFDGTTSKNISEKKIGKQFFSDIVDMDLCYGEWDGQRYWFYYDGANIGYVDSCLICDFSDYPDVRFYDDTFIPNAYEYHIPTGIKYYGNYDGYQYEESTGTDAFTTAITTREFFGKDIYHQKNLQYLYYDIDTGGHDVTVTFTIDGTDDQVLTLNHSGRTRKRIALKQMQGYRYSLKIGCDDSHALKIYEPWGVECTPFGD